MRLLFLALLLSIVPLSVQAGEVVACGVPNAVDMLTEVTADYCDIHQRRFAYRVEALAHKQQIEDRAANYVAPQIEALKRYEADFEGLERTVAPTE
jgi:hypothetical protein